MTQEQWGYLSGSIVALAVAYLYLLGYLNPQRNRLTRWVEWYVTREWVRGFRLSPRTQMLILGCLALVIGLAGVALFVASIL
jgi:hypothetical protein